MLDYLAAAEALREELQERRRDFHKHPELSFQETRTAGIVAEELRSLGLEVQTGVGQTGVVGILDGANDGPTVLVRADMDALPIVEETGAEYASINEGAMHACGHDGHTTIALGVAKLLADQRELLQGRVKFVFQPAEELGAGAKAMCADGVLTDPQPDVTLGLHLWNTMPVGTIGIATGPTFAAVSIFEITVTGRGGHGALPHETRDPIVAAAQLVGALQTICSREVPAAESVVLSVTTFNAGSAYNIIPPEAKLTGTLRNFTPEMRALATRRFYEICAGIGSALGCKVDAKMTHLTEPVMNDAATTERVRAAIRRAAPETQLDLDERTMGGEDVGLFMTDIPGTYYLVGSANAERGLNFGHHHPRFDIDEDCLPLGVATLAAAVGEFLLPT